MTLRHALPVLLAFGLLPPACGGGGDDDGGGDGDADADADADADSDGDADGDADACALPADAAPAVLELLVDSVPVTTCVDGRWRLNVRVCGEAEDAACADATGGACGGEPDDRLLLGDACESDTFALPTAGHYTLCVEAELVNGFVAYEECVEVDAGATGVRGPIEMDIDSEGQFPCVRDWTYDPDENMCCDYNVGFCAPPDY